MERRRGAFTPATSSLGLLLSDADFFDPILSPAPPQFFIQLCAAISQDPVLRRQAQPALVVQAPSESTDAALFSADIERFRRLAGRAEEALVKLVTGEVEAALKTHLTRFGALPEPSPP